VVRLTDLSDVTRKSVTNVAAAPLAQPAWVDGTDRRKRKFCIISSAGLGTSAQPLFRGGASDYREISDATPAADIRLSHVSVNFDRIGYQLDPEMVLPRQRLAELAAQGEIGGVAETHYSFMGASDPQTMETDARELARRLLADGVDSAILLPV
jgi:D-proline reductase (dithiol) PrdB